MKGISNLRQWIQALREHKEIIDITHEVDPHLELAEIHRRVAAADGPALFFHNVKGSKFPVVTNLMGSDRRIQIAFQNKPELWVRDMVELATKHFPPSLSTLWENKHHLKQLLRTGLKHKSRGAVTEMSMPEADLEQLPLLKSWPQDGGSFFTLPLVYTEPMGGGPPNLGIYRMHRYDKKRTGMHWQITKGGGFHHHQAEKQNAKLPVSIFLGGPPALLMSAIAPLPENVPELILCSILQQQKLAVTKNQNAHPIINECEFALVGHTKPHERHPEGPFGDHYGYYSWQHDFPVFHCDKIYHRKDAIYPATVVGKPRQEDYYIGNYLQELLSPLFPVVMPAVKALWSYGETGFHSLGAAVVHERYYRECMSSAFRILGEGQLSLTKFLLLTDQPVEVRNFKKMLKTILERFKPETDLFVFSNLSLDTLDYTGPELNKGSRGIMLGIGEKIRDLPESFQGSLPSPIRDAKAFIPGCLVLEVPEYTKYQDYTALFAHSDFAKWPLLILVDNLAKATKDEASFLWTVFTRFEPAADLHAGKSNLYRHHVCYSGPILIDARMKPNYPPEVLCDDTTTAQVTNNWKRYFPQGMAMGDSQTGHVI